MRSHILVPFKTLYREFWEYRGKIGLLIIFGFVSSFLMVVGIGTVIPLISSFMGDQNVQLPKIILSVFEYIPFLKNPFLILAFTVGLFFLRAVIVYYLNLRIIAIRVQFRTKIKAEILDKLLGASWPFFVRQKLGHVTETLFRDVDVVSKILDDIWNILFSLSNILVLLLFSFLLSPWITLCSLILGALAAGFFINQWSAQEVGKNLLVEGKKTAQLITEYIIGIKTIKSLSVQNRVYDYGVGHFKNLERFVKESGRLSAFHSVVQEPVAIVFVVGIFLVSYALDYWNFARFEPAVLAAILIVVQRIFVSLNSLQLSLHTVNEKMASVENLKAFRESIQNSQEKNTGVLPFSFTDSISFNQVSFSYTENSPIFRDLSFRIKKGEMIGIVGSSGAGKTTIADLLIRLIEPTQGEILMDGKDLREFSIPALRRGIGYVSQDSFLLHTSIEENIRFYHPDMSIEKIISAAKDAQIYDFVRTLPEEFRSVVGDRGMMVSGGQRQRIALARVLARSPEVLVLDEATSALDNESEMMIQKAIFALRGNVTVILIAHRLSTVMSADRVFVLDSGSIVEQGNPKELLQNSDSHFYRMYHRTSK